MRQLEGTKCSFLFCLGMSLMVFSVMYLRTRIQPEPKLPEPTCRPFSNQCKPFLYDAEEGVEMQRQGCQIERYIVDRRLQCSNLMEDLRFITKPLSSEEESYPLAFIMTVHKEPELFVRILRAIYMPQNIYCIHVDANAPENYWEIIYRVVGCFPNVFLASTREKVTYAGFSRLQADLNCMKDLVKSRVAWRKVVNMCGQDFPIKSNLELVQYLQSKEWRDKNMTPGIQQPEHIKHRTRLEYKEIVGSHVAQNPLGRKKKSPPHNLKIYFGSAYYSLTRGFVDFVLKNPKARDLLQWSRDTYSPDEHYWVTLNNIKEAPGSNIGAGWSGNVRAVKWRDQEGKTHNGCKGQYVRDICIYGMEDLAWIIQKNSMFANKFQSNIFPEGLDCLEQWHRNKVLSQAAIPIEPAWLLTTVTTVSNSSSS